MRLFLVIWESLVQSHRSLKWNRKAEETEMGQLEKDKLLLVLRYRGLLAKTRGRPVGAKGGPVSSSKEIRTSIL
jgi:hypothetical protein